MMQSPGIFIDRIELCPDGEDGICRLGCRVSQQVTLRNDSDTDLYCTVKGGEVAKQRGIFIEGRAEIELPSGCSESIDVSFLPKLTGIPKALVVFDFTLNDAFEDVSVDDFSIVRYISVRAGDPGDYAILKPIAPFIKQKKRYEDRNKFSNPVRVRSAVMSPFVIPLGKYPIPSKVHQLARDESEAMETIDKMFRGEGSRFDEKEDVDYSACLDADNYSECMQHLLWLEEVQMNGAF